MNPIQKILANYKKKKRIRQRKDAIRREKMGEKRWQMYVKRRRKRYLIAYGARAACVLVVLLLVFSLGRGIGKLVHGKSEKSDEMTSAEETASNQIVIGSTGCMIMHQTILDNYMDENGVCDFSDIFTYISGTYSTPDFMTCEMEGALGEAGNYSGYPTLVGSDNMLDCLKNAGVDLQLIATNHIYDDGEEGFQRTLDFYDSKEIAYEGAKNSESDTRYYIADIGGIFVGFLDYEFSYTDKNGLAVVNNNTLTEEDTQRLNLFDVNDPTEMYEEVEQSIAEMKEQGVQFIITNLHWGDEYQLEQNETQEAIAAKLCELGVDALIGGHPHCEQPIDVIESEDGSRQMFCIYSVGNSLSNQTAERMESEMSGGYTEDGVVIDLTLTKDEDDTVSITGVDAIPTWCYKEVLNADTDEARFYILPLDDVENLEETTGLTGIEEEAKESYERTMSVIGEGLEKAQSVFQ